MRRAPAIEGLGLSPPRQSPVAETRSFARRCRPEAESVSASRRLRVSRRSGRRRPPAIDREREAPSDHAHAPRPCGAPLSPARRSGAQYAALAHARVPGMLACCRPLNILRTSCRIVPRGERSSRVVSCGHRRAPLTRRAMHRGRRHSIRRPEPRGPLRAATHRRRRYRGINSRCPVRNRPAARAAPPAPVRHPRPPRDSSIEARDPRAPDAGLHSPCRNCTARTADDVDRSAVLTCYPSVCSRSAQRQQGGRRRQHHARRSAVLSKVRPKVLQIDRQRSTQERGTPRLVGGCDGSKSRRQRGQRQPEQLVPGTRRRCLGRGVLFFSVFRHSRRSHRVRPASRDMSAVAPRAARPAVAP